MDKVLYVGWYDKGNVGDEMYKVAFPTLFPGCDNKFRDKIAPDDLIWADRVVVGGGNIIDSTFIKMVKKHQGKKPFYFHSVGCTSSEVSPEQLAMFDRIWVRDVMSHRKLTSMGVECDLAPDASWVLEADRERGAKLWSDLFKDQKTDLYEKKVVVILNAHLTSSQPDLLARDFARWHSFAADLAQIIDSTNASFAFLPFGREMPWDDRVVNGWVAHKCKWHRKNAVVWSGDWDAKKTLDFVSGADAMISMRLHSTIFGTIGGTPFLDVTHHDKNRGFLESVGLSSWSVDYWDFSRIKASEILQDLLANGEEHRRSLDAVASVQRRRLLEYTAVIK